MFFIILPIVLSSCRPAVEPVPAKAPASGDKQIAQTNAGFESAIAKRIRANAPSPNTALAERLKAYRRMAVPPDWAGESPDITAQSYAGDLNFGSPFLIGDDTLALILTRQGLHLELWHLDLRNGDLRKVTEWKQGPNQGKYHSVSWHLDEGGKIVGQFVQMKTSKVNKRTGSGLVAMTVGDSLFKWLDPLTGETKTKNAHETSDYGIKDLTKKLLHAQLPETTEVKLTQGPAALAAANQRLARKGLRFDEQRAAVSLGPDILRAFHKDLDTLNLAESSSRAILSRDYEAALGAPSCPLTRELRAVLQFSLAAATEDQEQLKTFLHTNPKVYLRNYAAYESLHLIANGSDSFEDYADFVKQDPGTPARDAAMFRLHDIAFAAACRKPTVDFFDEYMRAFPDASQWKKAFDHAYDLELEYARYELQHAANPGEKREKRDEIANRFYTQLRASLRAGDQAKAERMWKLLNDERDFNGTKAAKEAQDAKDLDRYRAATLKLAKERNLILGRIEVIQRQQLAAMERANDLSEQANRLMREGNAQLSALNWKLDSISSKLNR
jgi:hypothetical protein